MKKWLLDYGYDVKKGGVNEYKIAFEDLLFKDPDAAEELYMYLELNTGGGGRQRNYSKSGTDTKYRYTD